MAGIPHVSPSSGECGSGVAAPVSASAGVPAPGEDVLVFRAGAESFAIAASAVEAIVELPSLQPLPGMPARMLGIAKLRGRLVPVYSPASVLNVSLVDPGAALIARVRARRGGSAVAVGAADDPAADPAGDLGRRVAVAIAGATGVVTYDPMAWSGVGGAAPRSGLVRGVATIERSLTTLLDAGVFLSECTTSGNPEPA